MIQVMKSSLIIVAAAVLVACAPTKDDEGPITTLPAENDTDKEVVNIHVDYGVTVEEVERVPDADK